MTVPSRDDPMWGPIPLPGNIKEIRPQQWDVIQEGKQAFDEGDQALFIEAPTGAGKSLIAECLRRLLGLPASYCSTTKNLQDQLAASFEYGRVIKGRANYPTELGMVDEMGTPWDRDWSAITCADCTAEKPKDPCRWCAFKWSCPYRVAKQDALDSDLAILNTAYWLRSQEFRRDLVIFDECDTLEDQILGNVSIEISPRRMKAAGLGFPEFITKPESWAKWMYYTAIPRLRKYQTSLGGGVKDQRERKSVAELILKLKMIKPEIAMGNWIYDGYNDEQVRFAPIMIDKMADGLVWGNRKFILMSATILSADIMADELGLYLPYKSISVPSTFPPENRPIYVCPIADMSFKAKEASQGATWMKMADGVRAVLRRHPDERILVHTVSYEVARYLKDAIKTDPTAPTEFSRRPIIIYTESDGKEKALRDYSRRPGAVLLAASMDRGVDLPDDLCRVQVIAKMPFPNFKRDKRVNARMHKPGGDAWYKSQAIRMIIQMSGRAIRHEQDYAVTYILDQQFTDNLWKSEFLFPKWWKEAVKWTLTPYTLLSNR